MMLIHNGSKNYKRFTLFYGIYLLSQFLFPFSYFNYPHIAHAEEQSTQSATLAPDPTPEPTSTPIPTVEPTATPEPTSTPVLTPEPTPNTTPESTPDPTSTPTATPEPTTTPSPTTEPTPTATPETTPSSTPTPTPIVEVIETATGGEVATVVIPDKSAESIENLNLDPADILNNPKLSTDKADYAPTDSAIITGTGFAHNATYSIKITSGDYNFIDNFTTDDKGDFVYAYQLDGVYRPLYTVEIVSGSGELIARTEFTDGAVGLYDQCSNDKGTGYSTGDTGCRWINGNLQQSNSTYFEEEATVQRLWLNGLTSGTHTITLKYGTTKGGLHAYDFLTTWNHSETWINDSDRCQGISGCMDAKETTFSIPSDPNVMGNISQGGDFTMRGGTITNITTPTIVSGSYSGDSETAITVAFNVSSGSLCSGTSCGVVLWFGAHIAAQADWGAGKGASSISGSPYHVALVNLDGSAIGSRDNQMASSAVPPASTITIHKVTVPSSDTTTNFGYTTSGSGYSAFQLSGGQQNPQSVAPGTYSVTESAKTGWTLTGLTCTASGKGTSAATNLSTGNVSITIGASGGGVVDCTYTNTRNKVAPTLVTTIHNDGNHSTGVTSVPLGAIVHDSVTATGPYENPTGSVVFYWYNNNTCNGEPINTSDTFSLSSGYYDATTFTKGPLTVGSYAFKARYSGDSNYTSGDSACEPLAVTKAGTTVTTQVHNASHTDVTNGYVTSGSIIHDSALVAGKVDNINITGSTTYNFYTTIGCTGTSTDQTVTVGSESSTTSALTPGAYSYKAEYSGDDNYNPSTGECEPFTVANARIQIGTTDTNEVDAAHTFTVTIQKTAGTGWLGISGIKPTVTFSPSNPGTITDNCASTGTNTSGQCTVVINSASAGVFTASASASVSFEGLTFSLSTNGTGENSGSATKTYVDAKITLSPLTSTNPVGSAHTVNVNVQKDPGTGPVAADNVLVTFSLVNNTPGATFVGGVNTCTTNSSGACSIQINSASPGSVEISATADILVGELTLTRTTDGSHGSSGNAAKTYEAGKINIVKETNPSRSQQSFEFDPSWDSQNFNLKDTETNPSGWLAPGTYSVAEVNTPADWTLTSATCSNGSAVNSINLAAGETVTCTFINTYTPALEITKTAGTTYTRTFDWTIDKSVSPETWNLFKGDSGTSRYTVAVTKDEGHDSAWNVAGSISIKNNAAVSANITGVSDVITGSITATVNCGVSFPHTLAAGDTLNCTYTANLPDGSARTNTATVAASGLIQGGTGTANVTFGTPSNLINDSVTVNDTNSGSWNFSDDTTVNYNRTFSCNTDQGTHNNTATIAETAQSDNAWVTVNCYNLSMAKTANTSLDRTYAWNINKTADKSALTLSPGQTFPVNYSVLISKTGSIDSNWAVAGTISINNPAPMSATINEVTDSISGIGPVSINCGVTFPYTLAAGSSLTCTYTGALSNITTRTNTASAVQQNYTYSYLNSPTSGGTTGYNTTASVEFSGAAVNEIDECVNITDSYAGNLGTVCVAEAPKTYTYTRVVGPYNASLCGIPQTVDNTATLTTNDTATTKDSNWQVNVNLACYCSLTQGYWKTHNPDFKGGAPVDDTWSLLSYGTSTPFFLSGKTWFDVFWTSPQGNAYYNLAHQYMAAKLNILNGTDQTLILSAVTQAESLFNKYTPTHIAALKNKASDKALRNQFINLAGTLGAYNEGETNPAGHCSEVPVSPTYLYLF